MNNSIVYSDMTDKYYQTSAWRYVSYWKHRNIYALCPEHVQIHRQHNLHLPNISPFGWQMLILMVKWSHLRPFPYVVIKKRKNSFNTGRRRFLCLKEITRVRWLSLQKKLQNASVVRWTVAPHSCACGRSCFSYKYCSLHKSDQCEAGGRKHVQDEDAAHRPTP